VESFSLDGSLATLWLYCLKIFNVYMLLLWDYGLLTSDV